MDESETTTEEGSETEAGPGGERRSSAELAVTAALQHLHETFKAMQTMGSSPKRSSSAAAKTMRCHHHHHPVCEHEGDHTHGQAADEGSFSRICKVQPLPLQFSQGSKILYLFQETR